MSIDFTVSDIIPATPQAIYDAWLDSAGHAAMTGGRKASIEAAAAGARFTVSGGYITGTTLALEPFQRIVQSWRTTRFSPDDPDSRIEITLAPVPGGGTRVTVAHSNVPDGHTSYRDGWQQNYFDPMKRHFGGAG